MAGIIKEIIVLCAACAIAAAVVPDGENGTGILKYLSSVLILACVASPVTTALSSLSVPSLDLSGANAPVEETTYGEYEEAVKKRTAANVADTVRRMLTGKYGFSEPIRVSVIFNGDDEGSLTLHEVQVFAGVRIDSYRDRDIEEKLSETLGCDVFIFSE